MNERSTNLLVTRTAFIVSTIISLLFYWGPIDSDFFSFLYVGQGILDGSDMYRDFADNKGPVLYLFFAFLRFIFNNHYAAMLFVGSTILDATTIVLVFTIMKRVWGITLPMTRTLIIIAFVALSVAWYKSFFLGLFPGGIYSESVAIPLLLGSMLMVSENKPLKSGVLFSLSVLTRLSLIFFLFYLIALLAQYSKKRALILFGAGTILPVLLFSLWFFIHGSFGSFIERMISWNISYVTQVSLEKISSVNSLISTVPNVFFSFIVILIGLIIVVLIPNKTNRLTAIMLFFSSLMSIFGAGIFYVHHGAQLLLAFFFSITVIAQLFRGTLLLTTLSIFFLIALIFNYAVFIYAGGPASFLSLRQTPPAIKEIIEKPYLHIIGYQPSFYFFYHKRSPDPYFIPAMLNMSLTKASKKNIERHKALAEKLVKQSAFVAVERSWDDIRATQEYLQTFTEPFALKEIIRYQDGPTRIIVYHSSLP